MPLDEALSRVVIDFSGRPGLHMDVPFKAGMIGGFDTQLAYEFFQGFANHALVTLHIDNLQGDNAHHQCETIFKAFARALRMALEHRSARGRRDPVDQGAMRVRVAPQSAAAEPDAMRTVAVVDYGMGNLRSVSQAVLHVAAGSGLRGRRHVGARRGATPPSASCCRARARCPTACASCASPGCRRPCSTRPRASR